MPSTPPVRIEGAELRTQDLDFAKPVAIGDLQDGVTAGHVGDEPVLLWRKGAAMSLVAGKCTHYGAPLAKGRVVGEEGEQILCPWHHACFSLRDGGVTKAPGLAPLGRYAIVREGDTIRAGEKLAKLARPAPKGPPRSVTIVGGGAAAISAAAELQSRGFVGNITILSADDRAPYDRTKLSKACLAGKASVSDLPLATDFLPKAEALQVRCNESVIGLDLKAQRLTLASKREVPYDKLLLATGAEPSRPPIEGADGRNAFVLRTAADGERLLAAIKPGKRVAIIGASFIGLEAASALRARGVGVEVVFPQSLPLAQVVGQELAQVLRSEHERQGVVLHAQAEAKAIDEQGVQLKGGKRVAADVVLLATGVKPKVDWLKAAGLQTGDGVLVDAELKTNDANIYAAGDVAAHRLGSERTRIEHWSVAEQMGRVAARNLLGEHVAYRAVPFFWTEHYDYKIRYVGHAKAIDHCEVFGDIEAKKAVIAVFAARAIAAVITIGRDDISMACEQAMAAGRPGDLAAIVRS